MAPKRNKQIPESVSSRKWQYLMVTEVGWKERERVGRRENGQVCKLLNFKGRKT